MGMLDDLRAYLGEIGSHDPGHQVQLIREWVKRGGCRPGEGELSPDMLGHAPIAENPVPPFETESAFDRLGMAEGDDAE